MSMKKKFVLWCFLLFSISTVTGQEYRKEITFVTLEFWHSLRIPNHHIKIELKNIRDEVSVDVLAESMSDDKKWNVFNRDTTFTISKEQYASILLRSVKLKEIDLEKASIRGLDGTTCSLKIGHMNSISYRFWTPNYATKSRGLEDFLNLVEDILRIAGFDPKEIL